MMVMTMKKKMRMRMRSRSCEKARVIQSDGQVRQVELPMSVGDLLRLHPHHYVKEAITRRTKFKASMMPIEAQLESGGIYLLLHLPRLFPSSSASSLPLPPLCACFRRVNQEQESRVNQEPEGEREKRAKCGPSIWMGKRHQRGLLFFTSRTAQSFKVSPDETGLGLGLASSVPGDLMKRNRIWEPSLEIILEDEILSPQSGSRKQGELVQEMNLANQRIEQQIPQPISSSCNSNSKPSSSSSRSRSSPRRSSSPTCKPRLRMKKKDSNAVIIL